jgi:hypothetical protein
MLLALGVPQRIALTINEELGLHNRLIDELDEEVGVTSGRLAAAQARVRRVLNASGAGWKWTCGGLGAFVALLVVILLGFKFH